MFKVEWICIKKCVFIFENTDEWKLRLKEDCGPFWTGEDWLKNLVLTQCYNAGKYLVSFII